MQFQKSLQPGSDYAAALAEANDIVAEHGGRIIKTVTEDEDGSHILVRKGSSRVRVYFHGPPTVGKSMKPAAKIIKADTYAQVLGVAAFLTAHNDVMKAELAKKGKGPVMENNFMKRVAEIRSRDGCSHMDAMATARVEHADEFATFQGTDHRAQAQEQASLAKRAREEGPIAKGAGFMAKVREIRKRDGSKHTVAMTTARVEHPDLYQEWQAAN